MDVLRKAVEAGRNMVVSRQIPLDLRTLKILTKNPIFLQKRDFIAKHRLVLLQLSERPQGTSPDYYLQGLAEALAWEQYHLAGRRAGREAWASENVYFGVPETSLEALAKFVQKRLNIRALRVIGNPQITLRKVALVHGRILAPALREVLKEPAVDAVILGEPVETDACPYFQDLIASGQKRGLLALGLSVSEEPGVKRITARLKSFVPEIPVDWIPAGEPYELRKARGAGTLACRVETRLDPCAPNEDREGGVFA